MLCFFQWGLAHWSCPLVRALGEDFSTQLLCHEEGPSLPIYFYGFRPRQHAPPPLFSFFQIKKCPFLSFGLNFCRKFQRNQINIQFFVFIYFLLSVLLHGQIYIFFKLLAFSFFVTKCVKLKDDKTSTQFFEAPFKLLSLSFMLFALVCYFRLSVSVLVMIPARFCLQYLTFFFTDQQHVPRVHKRGDSLPNRRCGVDSAGNARQPVITCVKTTDEKGSSCTGIVCKSDGCSMTINSNTVLYLILSSQNGQTNIAQVRQLKQTHTVVGQAPNNLSGVFICTSYNTASSAASQLHCVGGCWDRTRTVATLVLVVRRSKHSARYHHNNFHVTYTTQVYSKTFLD